MNGLSCRIGSKHLIIPFNNFDDDNTEVKIYNICETEVVVCFDGETTSSVYTDEKYFIFFNGYLQSPLPNWTVGKPADSALESAKFLLTLYKLSGYTFLTEVNGHFTVLIICRDSGKVIAATDNSGNRRLFYSKVDGELHISTHLLCLSYKDCKNIEINKAAFFLSYEFLPNNRTIYDKVFTLKPNEILTLLTQYQLEKKAQPNIKTPKKLQNIEIAIDLLYEEFKLALEDQVPTNKKVAVLLGGFDSALVAAVLVDLGKEVETFTFDFEDSSYNQPNIKEFTKAIGCKHTLVRITHEIIEKGLLNYSNIFNQPSSQAHYLIQANYVTGLIREKGYEYCFTGDGCDDIFLGYPSVYRRAHIIHKLRNFPKQIATILRIILGNRCIENTFGYLSRITRNVLLMLVRPRPTSGFIANRIFDNYSLPRLSRAFNDYSEISIEKQLTLLAKKYSSLSLVRLAFKGKSMVGTSRNKTEGSSMYNGVVLQSPFYHQRFKQLVSRIDDELLRPSSPEKKRVIGKYVFVEMVRKYKLLPEKIIFQKKASPVTAPVDNWYSNQLREDIIGYMQNLPFHVNIEYLINIMKFRHIDVVIRKKTLGRYLFQPISLIVTYARYFPYSKEENK